MQHVCPIINSQSQPNIEKSEYTPTPIRMMSSSRDIYFHMPSRNQTKFWHVEKYWLESFRMSMPLSFLINSFSSFCLLLIKPSATDLKCSGPFNCKKLPSMKPNLNLAIELKSAKFQNILASASWFRAWTPLLESQTNNAIEIMCWFQKSNIVDLQ